MATNPYRLRGPHRFKAGDKIRSGPQVGPVAKYPLPLGGSPTHVAHKWAGWLHNPYRLGGPQRFRAGIKSEVAHKQAGWLLIPPAWGVPIASKRGTKLEVAHKRARWLNTRCRFGGPQYMWPTSGPGGYITPTA